MPQSTPSTLSQICSREVEEEEFLSVYLQRRDHQMAPYTIKYMLHREC